MFHRTDKKKSNNKGFSLVELIVVIAIMAVLVAVLAPQFTKYIDQSRKSNDAATVSGIVTAVQVGLVDSEYSSSVNTTYIIDVTKTGTILYEGTVADGNKIESVGAESGSKTLADAIKDSCGDLGKLKVTAKAWTDIQVEIKVDAQGGVTVKYPTDFENYINGTK